MQISVMHRNFLPLHDEVTVPVSGRKSIQGVSERYNVHILLMSVVKKAVKFVNTG